MTQTSKSWNLRWDAKFHHFQFFTFKFQWISDLRWRIEGPHRDESIWLLNESRSLRNDEKNDETWKSWNLRSASKCWHVRDYTFKLWWILDVSTLIDRSHRAESIAVLEKSRSDQNQQKSWNLWKSSIFDVSNRFLSLCLSRLKKNDLSLVSI